MVECPVPEEARVWLEKAFQWLLSEFDKEMIIHRKVLRPIPADFPITFTQTEKDAEFGFMQYNKYYLYFWPQLYEIAMI